MPVSVNLTIAGRSWCHRTDPRVKLLFVAEMLFLLILYRNVWTLAVAFGLLHLLHWSAGTPFTKLTFIWRTLLPVGLLMLILRMLFYPAGTVWFAYGPLQVTSVGLAEGMTLALRIVTMALVVFAWLYTTSQPDLIQSFVRLGMPHAGGLTLALALRYIPTVQGTYTRIAEAQQARGLDMGQSKGFQRVKLMMPIFIAMIISSLRSSNELALALESRGYGRKGRPRTVLHPLKFTATDLALTLALLAVLLLLIWLRLWYGLGAHPLLLTI